MTTNTPSEQFNSDQFWKSQSMDTINQLLNGCHSMNLPLTPIASDGNTKQMDSRTEIVLSSSGNATNSITPSLSFSSVFPALQSVNSANSLPLSPPNSSSIQPSSPISQASRDYSPHHSQSLDHVENHRQLQTLPSSASASVSSMLINFQATGPITQSAPSREIVKVEKEPTYVDVTPFLVLPQHEAARRLGVPCSTLSKRWKEASVNRKWPYRIVCKLDKEITTLLKNVESSAASLSSPLSPAIEENLGLLLRKRQEELRTVVIRIN